jgi:histidinol dehydrogenase
MKVFEIASDAALHDALAQIEAREASGEGTPEAGKLEGVRAIVDAVRQGGDAAVREYTRQFEGVDLSPDAFEVPPEQIDEAMACVDPALLDALRRAHDNILRFHEKNLLQSWRETQPDGTVMGQDVTPIDSVGVFVPGFTAFYPSSALMNLVPAKVAGVRERVMVSPPTWEGGIHPLALAAARLGGATRVFRIGGTPGIAALAYGTETIPRVLKITGPGSIYVTLAKRLVSSVCDIDKEAGPSDVVVIADESTDPRLAAVELMCQAEHNDDSPTTLVCLSRAKADAVLEAIENELPSLSRAETIRKALAEVGLVLVARSLDEAALLTNHIAPEHLAIQTAEPESVFAGIRNAGAVMLGATTPVAASDYYAGPNHILPTGRRARFSSPLTVEDFRKVTNVLSYSPERLRQDAGDIIRLAEAEELTAHARSVEARL